MGIKMGRLVCTRGVNDTIADNEKFAKEIMTVMSKYVKCDWGDTCDEDKKLNDKALKNGDDRIVAKYLTSKGNVFIITEWDRSATTVLFASEY